MKSKNVLPVTPPPPLDKQLLKDCSIKRITKDMAFRIECQQAVEMAKLSYLENLGDKLNNPNTFQNSYWKIINRVMNKCRAPKIPPASCKQFVYSQL